MSLILEALKKSEAERRLGRAPGLLDEAPATRRGQRLGPLHWAIGLCLLMAVAALAYLSGQRDSSLPTPAAPPAQSSTTPSPTTARAQTEDAAAAPEAVGSEPVTASAAPTARPIASVAAPLPPPPAAPASTSASSERAPTERESSARAPQALPSAQPALPPATAPASTAAIQPQVPPALSPGEEIGPAAAAGTAPVETLASISSLDAALRAQLPPLKISMHVFTEDPAGRVLIVDGRRLKEGDPITERLRLREIRRDGGVLEFDGRRLLLERP